MKNIAVIVSVLGIMASCSLFAAESNKASETPQYTNGVLLLTFDDPNWPRWEKVLPLFAKYGAHASFFPNGKLNKGALVSLKNIYDAGHTVGPHTLNHADLPKLFAQVGGDAMFNKELKPQLDALATVGIHPTAMAFPNNRHTPEVDAYLMKKGFKRFRAGHVVRFDPKKQYPPVVWAETDEVFFPVADLPKHMVLEGVGMGPAYNTDIDDVCRAIERAAKRNEVLVIYSHDISPKPNLVSSYVTWIEKILETAGKCKIAMLGFNDLDK